MRITVRLFAGLRELAGTGRRDLELPAGSSLAEVWTALELGDEPPGLLYAVNREYAEPDRKLSDGDEVALIPPVSGGAFRLTEAPVNLTAVVVAVVDKRAGRSRPSSGPCGPSHAAAQFPRTFADGEHRAPQEHSSIGANPEGAALRVEESLKLTHAVLGCGGGQTGGPRSA